MNQRLKRMLAATEGVLGTIAAVLTLAMMAITVADVFMRNMLARPVFGSYELTQILLLLIIFVSLPIVSIAGAHITVDFLDHSRSRIRDRVVGFISNFVCALVLFGAAWLMLQRAVQSWRDGDITATLLIPTSPIIAVIVLGAAVSGIVHVCLLNAGTRSHAYADDATVDKGL